MKKLFGKRGKQSSNKKWSPAKIVVSLGVVVLLATGGFYGYMYWNKPDRVSQRVFWGAVNQNLQTSSFTRTSTIKQGGQSSEQRIDVFLTPKQGIHSQTKFIQTGVDEAEALTENIGTPYDDYVRYINVTSSQKNSKGEKYDFSKIIGVWGGTNSPDKTQTDGQQFGQSVLASIPVGNLTLAQRQKLIKMMKDNNVYKFENPKVTREGVLMRPSLSYTVSLAPSAYVKILKQFGEDIGLTQLKSLNPDDYKKAPSSSFQITVDGWSKHITSMVEPGSSRTEYISGRNARKVMPGVPNNAVTMQELQSRLQSIE